MRIDFEKIKQWIYRKAEEETQPEINELIWIKKKLVVGEKIDWTFVDTVDYNIESIPRKREIVLEFEAKPKELMRKCQNLLN